VKSSKTYLLVILACTTIGGAAYAWKQYQELIQLRAAALGTDERSDLQKRLWAAEKRAKDLADQLAAARTRGEEASDEKRRPRQPR
jgi:predicted  nucleic acid-binding Zn-ribbon protein